MDVYMFDFKTGMFVYIIHENKQKIYDLPAIFFTFKPESAVIFSN